MVLPAKLKYGTLMFLLLCLMFSVLGLAEASGGTEAAAPHNEDAGIIGSFFHFVGDVIALPFQVVGKTVDAIF